MMDFTLAETQQAVAALTAEVLAGSDPRKELARAGLLDVTSLGVLDLAVLLTEIGRRAPSVQAHATLGGPDCVWDLYQLAVAGECALADGAVAGALALTRDHVATREQFGRPLAAFQAVSQQIADVYIASRTLHLAALSACWRLEEGLDAGADLGVAGYWCAEQAPRSVRICHHLHGGLGMDVTYPLHRFSSLVADLVRYLGGAEYRLERQACSST